MDDHRMSDREAAEELGRLWDTGIDSGPAVDGEEAFARIRATLEASIAARWNEIPVPDRLPTRRGR